MSETATPQPQSEASDARLFAILCYALFIAVFTNGITGIVAVVLAYIKRADVKGTIWESHFDNVIQVFWIGIAVFVVLLALAAVVAFGVVHTTRTDEFAPSLLFLPAIWLLGVLYVVWYLYRTVKGLMRAIDRRAYG